jgi:hypothetical protein
VACTPTALLALAVAAIEVLPHELLVFGYLHSGKKTSQEEDHIAYKQFLSLYKHVSHDVSKFK